MSEIRSARPAPDWTLPAPDTAHLCPKCDAPMKIAYWYRPRGTKLAWKPQYARTCKCKGARQ